MRTLKPALAALLLLLPACTTPPEIQKNQELQTLGKAQDNRTDARAFEADPGEFLCRLLQYLVPDPGRVAAARCHAELLHDRTARWLPATGFAMPAVRAGGMASDLPDAQLTRWSTRNRFVAVGPDDPTGC